MTLHTADLRHFIGTENWYKHPLFCTYTYTDGVQYVACEGHAYWLIDAIFSHQLDAKVNGESFQVWTLTVTDDSAKLTGDDGNGTVIAEQEIDYTDFPLPEIRFYLTNKVLMLPSEY